MFPQEVVNILGEPENLFIDEDVLDMHLFDPGEKALIISNTAYFYDGSVPDHAFFSVTFFQEKLVEIRVRAKRREILFEGENLMDSDRKALMRRLAAKEDTIYANGPSYFFPRAGIQTDAPKFWASKGSVDFVVNQYVVDRFDMDGWVAETKIVIEGWRQHYNTKRPHSSLGYRSPALEVVQWPAPSSGAASPATPAAAPKPVLH